MKDKERLTHWSDKPVQLEPRQYHQEQGYKPRGLWFDVDEDWKRWCEGEEFGLQRLAVPHAVSIRDHGVRIRASGKEVSDSDMATFRKILDAAE